MPLKILIGICLLRASPQDLPASRAGMLGALVAYAAAGVLGVLDVLTFENAILAAAVDTLLLTAVTHLVLPWRRLENRLTQTLTALAGCGYGGTLTKAESPPKCTPSSPPSNLETANTPTGTNSHRTTRGPRMHGTSVSDTTPCGRPSCHCGWFKS